MSDYREKFRPTPGTLLREETYKEIATHLDDHPEYVEYARGSRFIIPGEIMDTWINGNITNESVYSCVPFLQGTQRPVSRKESTIARIFGEKLIQTILLRN